MPRIDIKLLDRMGSDASILLLRTQFHNCEILRSARLGSVIKGNDGKSGQVRTAGRRVRSGFIKRGEEMLKKGLLAAAAAAVISTLGATTALADFTILAWPGGPAEAALRSQLDGHLAPRTAPTPRSAPRLFSSRGGSRVRSW